MRKIAICNSVGIDKNGYYIIHSPSRWSWGQKNNKNAFTYYPWELAYCSSLLKRETNEKIKFFDGCLKKYNVETYFNVLAEFKPDFLVMEPSGRTLETDKELMQKIKNEFNTKLIVCGPIATAFPQNVAQWADFVCIGEYEYTVLDIIKGKENISGLYPNGFRDLIDVDLLPFPEDEDVSRFEYAIPGEPNCEYLEIQAYASRGCPLKCSFCVCGNLYYKKANWRPRAINSIISEIKYLKEKYPKMEGIFFDEEIHNGSKKFIKDLCNAIIENGLNNLKFNAMCCYYNLDEEIIELMKKAGYYKLRIGIETASEKTAAGIGMLKKYDLLKLEKVLESAKKIGMKIYGTFTIGAPGSTFEEDLKTAELVENFTSRGLITDAQFSINTPQPGTPFYWWAKQNGFLISENFIDYDGGNTVVVDRPDYPASKVKEAFDLILKKYDEGLERFRSSELVEKYYNSLKKINVNAERFLLLRSSRMWQINIFIQALKKCIENKQIDIICQPIIEEEVRKNKEIKNIYFYNNGFFSFDIFLKNKELVYLKNKYDYTIVFCNNTTTYGYEEVIKIAEFLSWKKIIVLNNGEIKVDG
ncbi:MAG TPA: radical SAM protein [bacterium]|nr:radical SAM protein [bacterium]HOL46857.1 radical SAM protein [bacterium]HPQ18794.1 radical SAM protein [bacterium]